MIDQDLWATIASVKPKLRPHTQFYCHTYRGQTWYVLADNMTAKHFRCPANVYQFLQQLDGRHTLEEAYQQCLKGLGEEHPDPSEILRLIATLQEHDLLQGAFPITAAELYQRQQRVSSQRRLQKWTRPLSVKWSVCDPDQWLNVLRPFLFILFNRWVFGASLLVIGAGFVTAMIHWPELTTHWSARFMDPQNLLWLWLLYPLVKLLHELGHAVATKVWGGEVHEMGLLFLVFVPVPYVDASSSHQFSQKRRRMIVAAAGILVELVLAGLALLLWVNLNDGLIRDIAFDVAVIGGLSTLFINGNPLLRFDGYYVLADGIEIPNLATRSTQYLDYLCKRLLVGGGDIPSPLTAVGERRWFIGYGLAAGCYRLIISIGITLFVSSHYLVVGVILGSWFFLQQLLWPMLKAIKSVTKLAYQQHKLPRFVIFSSTIIGAILMVLFVYPLPSTTHIEGIVKVPENAVVRATTEGFLQQVSAKNGQRVVAGESLFMLENSDLRAKHAVLSATLAELRARQSDVLSTDLVGSQVLKDDIRNTEAELLNIRNKLEKLNITSAVDGIFSVQSEQDLPGRFYRKGDVLGYVVDFSAVTVNTMVPQHKLNELQTGIVGATAKLYSRAGDQLPAVMGREVPRATYQLPSAVLGSAGGGSIQVDARDSAGRKAIDSVYQLEISLPAYSEPYLAAKVSVKLEHHQKAIGVGWYDQLRRFLLDHFQI